MKIMMIDSRYHDSSHRSWWNHVVVDSCELVIPGAAEIAVVAGSTFSNSFRDVVLWRTNPREVNNDRVASGGRPSGRGGFQRRLLP
eukprot:scaffold328_cov130-Cylindrotheca_fusiformis.AAC.20